MFTNPFKRIHKDERYAEHQRNKFPEDFGIKFGITVPNHTHCYYEYKLQIQTSIFKQTIFNLDFFFTFFVLFFFTYY